mgnify:CR=1 FL=1|jgi:dTDP-4-dehydrorhamnose 3,5-epimerase
MIEGVIITPLKQFLDERGKVMHMLKNTDEHFNGFGEIYFSTIYPGAIKGWHQHSDMTLNYAVPWGQIKFVLFDDRKDSRTKGTIQEIFIGPENYNLVTVPPKVWNGFKGVGAEMAIVANCSTIPHDSDEIKRISIWDEYIPYKWIVNNN